MNSEFDMSKLLKLNKDDLVAMLSKLLEPNNTPSTSVNDKVVVVSNVIGEIAICPTKSREINFQNYGDRRIILFNDISLIAESPRYQKLFQKGFLYFEDDQYYDEFYISKPDMLMTFENIENILSTKSEDELITFLDKFSEHKTCPNFMHFFPIMTAKLIRNGYNLDYRNREIISDYFSIKLDSLVNVIDMYNKKLI